MIRNLVFYCYPLKGTIWPWHVERLLEHKDVWNGRKVLVLSLDHLTDSEEAVRERFSPLGAEVLVRKNNPLYAEQAHFIEALSFLESRRDDEATFYAHAKGVTREGRILKNVLRWSSLMYQANLSFPSLIERRLLEFSAVGCLRWKLEPPRKGWCYAGTFFWLKHSAIFSRDWKKINRGIYGVEDYPGRQFKFEEGCCLTREQVHPERLYAGCVDERFIRESLEALSDEEHKCTIA